MKLRAIAALLSCLAPLVPSPAHPQTSPVSQELEEVVVTATRTERKTEEIPAGVSVVGPEELENSRLLGVKEALTGLAGVQAETRNGGYDARLIIRGAGLKARYGVREIMILLDGVPITDPDGMTRFDFVDTRLIERVDVVKGPNSTLYGANAAGGVIHILTRSPYEQTQSLQAGFGSDDTRLLSLIASTSLGETYLTLTGTHKASDGWREWNEFESNQAGLKAGRLFADGSSLDWNFSYTEADLQLPGTLSKEQYEEDPGQLTDEPFRHSSRDSAIWFTSLKGEKTLGPVTWRPLVYFQDWEHFHPVPGGINDGGAEVYGADLQGDWSHRLFSQEAVLTAGLAGQVDRSEGKKYTYRDVATLPTGRILHTLSDRKGELAETSDGTVGKWGVYAQESFRPADKWLIDLGLRYDQVRFDTETEIFQEYSWGAGRFVPAPQSVAVDETFECLSPRLGVVWEATSVYHLYGTIGTGFQTPQSTELEENPRLEPARTVNYETGLKARYPAGHSFDLAVFYMEVSDEIVQSYLPGGTVEYSNAGETAKKGVELAVEIEAAAGLRLGGAYTWSDFEFAEFDEPVTVFTPTPQTVVIDRGGNQLPYIPEHQYSLYAAYRHPSGWKGRIETLSWGDYYVDNANSEHYSGYDFLTNAMVGWENERWNLILDVQNVFDKHYAIEVTKDSMGDPRYRPGAPRTWFAKVSYSF